MLWWPQFKRRDSSALHSPREAGEEAKNNNQAFNVMISFAFFFFKKLAFLHFRNTKHSETYNIYRVFMWQTNSKWEEEKSWVTISTTDPVCRGKLFAWTLNRFECDKKKVVWEELNSIHWILLMIRSEVTHTTSAGFSDCFSWSEDSWCLLWSTGSLLSTGPAAGPPLCCPAEGKESNMQCTEVLDYTFFTFYFL